jgi:hypothetical protein
MLGDALKPEDCVTGTGIMDLKATPDEYVLSACLGVVSWLAEDSATLKSADGSMKDVGGV